MLFNSEVTGYIFLHRKISLDYIERVLTITQLSLLLHCLEPYLELRIFSSQTKCISLEKKTL